VGAAELELEELDELDELELEELLTGWGVEYGTAYKVTALQFGPRAIDSLDVSTARTELQSVSRLIHHPKSTKKQVIYT
jgi:hypothetical protein